MSRKTLLVVVIILLGLAAWIYAANDDANGTKQDKVNICHATSSESNPYEAIRINASAWDGEGENDHTKHEGDFLYEGPVNPINQQPTDDSWCEPETPEDPEEPEEPEEPEVPETPEEPEEPEVPVVPSGK